MTLAGHLAELRSRLVKAILAVTAGGVVGWFLYDRVFTALQRPFLEVRAHRPTGSLVELNFTGITDPFSLKIKISIFIGLLLASPVWIYQIWAFITPGLHRNERRYAIGFLAAALPLFLGGAYLAWLVMPKAVSFLLEFTPNGASNILDLETYLNFVIRFILAFGAAFLIPVIMVGVNMAGLVSARRLASAWRITIFGIFLFAAMMTPTPDAWTMLLMGSSIVLLYLAALGLCFLNDRRRARRAAAEPSASWSDDEASPLPEADRDAED